MKTEIAKTLPSFYHSFDNEPLFCVIGSGYSYDLATSISMMNQWKIESGSMYIKCLFKYEESTKGVFNKIRRALGVYNPKIKSREVWFNIDDIYLLNDIAIITYINTCSK